MQKLNSIEQLCYGNNQTLTISNISNNSTIWQVSSNVTILSSNNNSIIIRTSLPNSTGNGIYFFSKTWQELFGLGGVNIEWKILGTSILKRNSGPNSILIYPTTTNHGQIITIAIRSRNECGYSNWKYQDFRIYSTTFDGGIGRFSVVH